MEVKEREMTDYTMRPVGTSQAKGLVDMIVACYDILKKPLRVLEIGSYRGESTQILLQTGFIESITCIDAWENGYDDDDAASYTAPMSRVEKQFDEHVAPYKNVTKIKGKSGDVVGQFEDGTFDLIYIDGDHRYEGCKSDIINFLPKIKNGGVIAGHDGHHPPIRKAIADTIGKVDQEFVDTSWLKKV